MTAKSHRTTAAVVVFMLFNGIVSKPLNAQVPGRPEIPQIVPKDIQQPQRSLAKEELFLKLNLTPEHFIASSNNRCYQQFHHKISLANPGGSLLT